jgi:hypothetical protein
MHSWVLGRWLFGLNAVYNVERFVSAHVISSLIAIILCLWQACILPKVFYHNVIIL